MSASMTNRVSKGRNSLLPKVLVSDARPFCVCAPFFCMSLCRRRVHHRRVWFLLWDLCRVVALCSYSCLTHLTDGDVVEDDDETAAGEDASGEDGEGEKVNAEEVPETNGEGTHGREEEDNGGEEEDDGEDDGYGDDDNDDGREEVEEDEEDEDEAEEPHSKKRKGA